MKKAPTLYFTISHMSKILGISPSSLRAWELMGLLQPARSQGRYRLYTRQDLKAAKRILHLRRDKGLNLAGVAHMLSSEKNSNHKRTVVRSNSRDGVSRQLLEFRRRQDYTLAQVSRKAGLSISFLSAIERGQAKPSISTLQRLAAIYKTNVLSLFGASDGNRSHRLVRPSDRKILRPEPGLKIELLVLDKSQMEPHIFRIAPGISSGGSYHHEGEEFIHVLQGSVEVWLDEVERYVLTTGDTLHFESKQAHRWTSLGKAKTVLFWVNTPPTF